LDTQLFTNYLKDVADPIHYCKVVTALAHTIRLQTEIDPLYQQMDEEMGRKASVV
jgi:hypothetical protein